MLMVKMMAMVIHIVGVVRMMASMSIRVMVW